MGWWHHGWGLGLGGWQSILLGGVMMLFFWAGLFLLLFLLLRGLTARDDSFRHASGHSALSILDDRYARGEIEADEYAEMKRVLEG
jgi:putative membrane protein